MTDHVTIGVPVYHGELFVADAVESILDQTHHDWQVVFSVDGPDPASEAACRQYEGDDRFRVVVQPERLGWVRNIAWLQEQAAGDFWYYHQQDDLTDPTYLEVLIDAAHHWPDAAVVYCDMETFGDRDLRFARPSVTGSPIARQLSVLTDQFAGVAFRGLTRVAALRATGGGIVENDVENFAAEVTWIAAMATWGDLIRVPLTLYRKRYHPEQAHRPWLSWDVPTRRAAWTAQCHDLVQIAMGVPAEPPERWLLWLAAVVRLTASRATPYLPWAEFTAADRVALIDGLIDRIRQFGRIDLPALLVADWPDIRRRSLEYATPDW